MGDGRNGDLLGLLAAEAEGDGGHRADRAVDAEPAVVTLEEAEAGGIGVLGTCAEADPRFAR